MTETQQIAQIDLKLKWIQQKCKTNKKITYLLLFNTFFFLLHNAMH